MYILNFEVPNCFNWTVDGWLKAMKGFKVIEPSKKNKTHSKVSLIVACTGVTEVLWHFTYWSEGSHTKDPIARCSLLSTFLTQLFILV